MSVAILIISILCVALSVILLIDHRELEQTKQALDYYRSRLLKMVANDTLVKESIEIICEAYHVEEGDLRNYISEYQKRKENQ